MSVSFSHENQLPLICTATNTGLNLSHWAGDNIALIEKQLEKHGAILFRDFNVVSADDFADVIEKLYQKILPYLERSSPRNHLSRNIFTSTELTKDADIFLHNEQSYNIEFPMRTLFYCHKPPVANGRTPIADTRKIFQRLSNELRKDFINRKYRYTRNLGSGIGLNWQTAYQTDDKEVVAQYCKDHDIQFEWISDKVLRTHQIRDVVAKHPTTQELCWFNHLTFFNMLTLPQETQTLLRKVFKDEELPNNTYYGDGSKIPDNIIEELKRAYLAEERSFAWQKSDVLLLDNMLTAHGRQSFTGDREIYAGFAEMCNWQQVKIDG